MYYIYILRCDDESLYTGITTNMIRRYHEHVSKNVKAAKYTKRHAVKSIEALWTCSSRSLASSLEYRIKHLTKDKKERLINDDSLFDNYFKDILDISLYKRIEDIEREMKSDDN